MDSPNRGRAKKQTNNTLLQSSHRQAKHITDFEITPDKKQPSTTVRPK
jgi:hypothetical protein